MPLTKIRGWLVTLLLVLGGAILVGAYVIAGMLDHANRALELLGLNDAPVTEAGALRKKRPGLKISTSQ